MRYSKSGPRKFSISILRLFYFFICNFKAGDKTNLSEDSFSFHIQLRVQNMKNEEQFVKHPVYVSAFAEGVELNFQNMGSFIKNVVVFLLERVLLSLKFLCFRLEESPVAP